MSNKVMSIKQLTGNEAVAWAAAESGVAYFAHYPGSPVNFIEPALKNIDSKYNLDITFNNALNEHIATLAAAGASFCKARSMVVMKHVGMNIAADPLNYIGQTGVKGGMVIIVGTDPGAKCSTGEEDPHWYVAQTKFPLFEPHSVNTIFTNVKDAYIVSEKYEVPVYIFLPTRLCYNSAPVKINKNSLFNNNKKEYKFKKNRERYILVGKTAVESNKKLINKIEKISINENFSETYFNSDSKTGFITRGITTGHTYEIIKRLELEEKVHLYCNNLVYPIHNESIMEFIKSKKEIVFIEDQDGFLEQTVKMNLFNEIHCTVTGKESFPVYGETNIQSIEEYCKNKFSLSSDNIDSFISKIKIPERIGTFCEGCPHRSSYYGIKKSFQDDNGIIGGDIGCSSLAPFLADWLMCMNAGIGVSQGMAHILKKQIVVSTGGDASFFHTGLISLYSAVQNNIDLLHIVFDNKLIAMTGHQKGVSSYSFVNHNSLLKSIGVKRIYNVKIRNPKKLTDILKKESHLKGVRVIWIDGLCQLSKNEFIDLKCSTITLSIDNSKCGSCRECYTELACPAIVSDKNNGNFLTIDSDRCKRCGTCYKICKNNAIKISLSGQILTSIKNIFSFVINKIRNGI